MILNKMKNDKGTSGFTIVELLIVIVVIGILAAITIVAYSGITARANATKAQTNAANVQKVAETYNADAANTGYPADAATLQAYAGLARVPSGVTVTATAVTSTNGTTTIQYLPKSTTGGCVGWWDFSVSSGNLKYIYVGNGVSVSAGACI